LNLRGIQLSGHRPARSDAIGDRDATVVAVPGYIGEDRMAEVFFAAEQNPNAGNVQK
jgi:hypothetical protein